MKITYTNIEIDRDTVFRKMDCRPDSPVYEDVTQAYEELLPQVMKRTEGACLFMLGEIEEKDQTEKYPAGTRVIYLISTVGRALSSLSGELFEEGEYLKGVMADAMADSCLFGLEQQWLKDVKEYCRTEKVGIRKRLEPPVGMSMSVQKTAFEYLNAEEELGMKITSGYMYDPVKSSCQILIVSEDTCQFSAAHNCRECPRLDCPSRRVELVKVTVCTESGEQLITCEDQESILSAYQRQIGYASAVCGGRGTCGKCRIQLLSGELDVTDGDRAVFTEEELARGYRLSCRAYPTEDCRIRPRFLKEDEFQVLSEFRGVREDVSDEKNVMKETTIRTGIAIDIGTTTLAAQMVDLSSGRILASASAVNRQRAYGADVISRLEASNSGKGDELQAVIRRDLDELIKRLLMNSGCLTEQVEKVMVAGNTVMCHLLLGYSCRTLGVYPFTPVNIGTIHGTYEELLGTDRLQADTWIFPGFSTYVGADITAGLYACGMEESEKIKLFVDLGTNGEMALGNRDRMVCASVAAGPAFEGGNISCGMGSIPGAVCHVQIDLDGEAVVETIQDQPPVGICGTGVIELTAELLRSELVDETGRLEETYEEQGYPFARMADGRILHMTQKDVREIQLAKAAVRGGVETMIKRYGISYAEISEILLAGGMGFQLDKEAAVAIGLLPEELKERIVAVGNSSLAGCVRALQDDSWQETAERLVSNTRELALAADEIFGAAYIEHMMFPEV